MQLISLSSGFLASKVHFQLIFFGIAHFLNRAGGAVGFADRRRGQGSRGVGGRRRLREGDGVLGLRGGGDFVFG